MNTKLQGAFVFVYKKTNLLMLSFSKCSQGTAAGHGKFEKFSIDSPDAEIGAALRRRISDRQDGHYVPQMWKERQAYLSYRKALEEDRGGMSENQFRKYSSSFNVLLEGGRIEFEVYEMELSRWVQLAILCLDASDDELGAAVKNAAEYVIS
ncbi:hypothetical protein [Roseateles sp.]|uniref:hypothetical protein n=1 Tax=Roseateles sp. TaxID=1971397 RepID=UPI0031E0E1E5